MNKFATICIVVYQIIKKITPDWLRSLVRPILVKFSNTGFVKNKFIEVKEGEHKFNILVSPQNGAVDSYIYRHKIWEPHLGAVIRKHVRPGMVCIDVGANIGYFSLLFSRFSGDSGQVYAFEPIKKLTEQIKESVVNNGIKNITIISKGAGSKKKEVTLFKNYDNIGGSSQIPKGDTHDTETITLVSLDEELANVTKIDFIKIDVEGFELDALVGMKNILTKHHPTLVVEFSPNTYQRIDSNISYELLDFLLGLGYLVYDIEHSLEVTDITKYLEKLRGRQANLLCTV